jgi:hypothetical protein
MMKRLRLLISALVLSSCSSPKFTEITGESLRGIWADNTYILNFTSPDTLRTNIIRNGRKLWGHYKVSPDGEVTIMNKETVFTIQELRKKKMKITLRGSKTQIKLKKHYDNENRNNPGTN